MSASQRTYLSSRFYAKGLLFVFLKVDLGTSYIVREVWMQGREDTTEVTSAWVRAFQMDYSVDNTVWTQYTDKQDGVAKAKVNNYTYL